MGFFIYSQTGISFSLLNTQILQADSVAEISLDNAMLRAAAGNRTASSQIRLLDFRGKVGPIVPVLGVQNQVMAVGNSAVWRGPQLLVYPPTRQYFSGLISPDTGYTDFSYLGTNVIEYIFGTYTGLYANYSVYYPQLRDSIKNFVIPENCSTITIQAWGGGAGSGGSWTGGSTPGNGGAGGYAQTTLTVGTDVFPGQVLFCVTGWGGAGGVSNFHSGGGGWGSAVYVQEGSWAYPASEIDYTNSFATPFGGDRTSFAWTSSNFFNATTCILVAGGGGGGGSVNWNSGTAGNGGSGGSVDSGTGQALNSGAGTGATTTAHGAGLVETVPGQVQGVVGGGVSIFGTVNPNPSTGPAFFSEATLATLASTAIALMDDSTNSFAVQTYLRQVPGGGGAFAGAPGPRRIVDSGATAQAARGGGGGSNKVYRGIGSTATSGISSTPPNPQDLYGYGGTGKGPPNPTDANRYAGNSGKPGIIYITFNA